MQFFRYLEVDPLLCFRDDSGGDGEDGKAHQLLLLRRRPSFLLFPVSSLFSLSQWIFFEEGGPAPYCLDVSQTLNEWAVSTA